MYRSDGSNLDVIHSDQCVGTAENLSELRTRLFLAQVGPNSEALEFAICQAARAGHRKCLRFLLQQTGMKIRDKILDYIVFLTMYTDSRQTMDLGLRLSELLTAEQRRSSVIKLLNWLVIKDNPGNLQHVLRRLGAACRTQTLDSDPVRSIFSHNTPMMAVRWKRHECLRLLLKHGAAVDSRQVAIRNKSLSAEMKDEASLILAWANAISFGVVDAKKESATLKMLFEFGSNVWETDADGLLPLHLSTTFPLDDLVNRDGPPEVRVPLVADLKQLMSAPRSLKSACRLVITRSMGNAYEAKIQHLGNLPLTLFEYLKFEDLKYEEDERDFDQDQEEESDEEGFEEFLVRVKKSDRIKKRILSFMSLLTFMMNILWLWWIYRR